MARKKTGVGSALEEAKVLDEAADIKLRAAGKMSRARILMDDGEEEVAVPEAQHFAAFEVPPTPQPAEAPLSNFESALADLNNRGRFEVYKLSMTGKRVKVGNYGLDEYPERMDSIAQEHGGGSFRILLKDERGQYVCSTTEDYDTKSYGGNKPVTEAAGATSVDRLMERMDAREADHRRDLESMRLENQKLMLMMVEKMSAPRQETSLIDAIKLVKELQGDQRSPMDSFREVLELANSVKEETSLAEPEHPLVAAIDKVMKVASPLLTAWVSKVAAPPPASGARTAVAKALPASTGKPEAALAVTPSVPGEIPAVAEGAPTPEPEVVVDPRLKQYAESLFQQVSAGNGFEVVGDTIINLTPDDALDELYTMATHPGFVGQILAAEPRLIPHQAWLANLTTYIKKEMDEAQAENDAAPEPVVAATPAPIEVAP
jgi:hypothetical protein